VQLAGLTAQVTESFADGRPRAVRFTFEHESSDYAFACWSEGHFHRCELPEQGRPLRLPADDLGRILFGAGAGPS
jgi:hypothetical protein